MSPEPGRHESWGGAADPPGATAPDDGFDEDLFSDLPAAPPADEPAPGRAPTAGGPAPAASGGWGGTDAGVEELLRQAVEMVASARRAPLSASVLVARDDLLEVLQQALEVLPDELRQARWLLRERDEFLAQRQREADQLIDTVRAQAERMVQRTEIVRQASQAAQRLVEDAREEARRLRHEAEDFCDQKLAAFEVVLERTARTVRAGRERLASPAPALTDLQGPPAGRAADAVPASGAGAAAGDRYAAAPGPDAIPVGGFDVDAGGVAPFDQDLR